MLYYFQRITSLHAMGNVPIKTAGGGFANFTDIAPMAVVNIKMTTKIKTRTETCQFKNPTNI